MNAHISENSRFSLTVRICMYSISTIKIALKSKYISKLNASTVQDDSQHSSRNYLRE